MSEFEERCLDAFPQWLRSLNDDARQLAGAVEDANLEEGARRQIAGALNYLFKSLDLIPDGIEDLGFIDDALVFRVASSLALGGGGGSSVLARLAEDVPLVREFLGSEFGRLEAYVKQLGSGAARGRSVDDIVNDEAVRRDLVNDVQSWADSYSAPSFARDAKNLVKLRSFLTTKLPA